MQKNDQTDLNEIAARWTDLWQDYISAMATDPSLADQMRRMAETYWSSLQGGAQHDKSGKQTFGTATTSPMHGNGHDNLAELRARIVSLEARLAALEASAGKAERQTPGRSYSRKNSTSAGR